MSRPNRITTVAAAVLSVLFMAALPTSAGAAEHVDPPDGADRVDMAVTPTGDGAWALSADGTVVTFGDARFHGQEDRGAGDAALAGIAAHPSGEGYWVADGDGEVWAFGRAEDHGQIDFDLNEAIVGIAATESGDGYWLAASDGGVFSFGDARYRGGMGDTDLNEPVVGITAAREHNGYWLVASDGGVFTFGNQSFHGSTGDIDLNEPMTDITSTNSGEGYWMVAADGGVFSFGDADFKGSSHTRDIDHDQFVAIETAWTQDGYFITDRRTAFIGFGDAEIGDPPAEGADPVGELRTGDRESANFPDLGEISLLTDIRTAPHPGFERIVFEFEPGDLEYRVRYVDSPPVSTAGDPVEVDGDAMLHINMSSASGVDLSGPEAEQTYTGPDRFSPDRLNQVQELAMVTDFEGNLEWVVGLREMAGFAVAVVDDPNRLVIDIAATGSGDSS